MPLFQYFGWVGSFLLAALLAANWWFPAPTAPTPASDVPLNQRINIRIHTDHRWPDRVVFDTTRSALALEAKVGPRLTSGRARLSPRRNANLSTRSPRWRLSPSGRVFDRPAPLVRVRSGRPRQEKHASSR